MKSLKITLACILSALIGAAAGCSGSSLSVNAPTKADAFAAVASAQIAWTAAATACSAIATTENKTPTDLGCGVPLIKAHDLIVSASAALDTNWNQSAACDLVTALDLAESAIAPLDPPTSVTNTLGSAVEVATKIVGALGLCPADAGTVPVVDAGGDVATPVADAAPEAYLFTPGTIL